LQGGVAAPSRNIPVPLKGADGAVVKKSVRFAKINKQRREHSFTNRPVCAAEEREHFLDRAATPPWKGGEFRSRNTWAYL
jgi:hypothetical protein